MRCQLSKKVCKSVISLKVFLERSCSTVFSVVPE